MRESKVIQKRRGRPPKLQSSRTVTDSSQSHRTSIQLKNTHLMRDNNDNEEDDDDAEVDEDSDNSEEPDSMSAEEHEDSNESDDDKFLKKLERKKEAAIDLDKMTRRQRMAY